MEREKKRLLRKTIAERKKEYSKEQLKEYSLLLLERLEKHPLFVKAHTILLYYSLPDEVQTQEFIEKWAHDKRIILPVVKGNNLELRHYNGKQNLQKGSYGIEEPQGVPFTEYNKIDLAIIPGVAFDAQGNRLGRGKGYYDRLLNQLKTYKIGICFHFQLCKLIPTETFDRPMDEVWSDTAIFAPTPKQIWEEY